MSSYFSFEGTINISRKFKIELIAQNYEEAQELAHDVMEDGDDIEQYFTSDPETEVEIDTYEETPIPWSH